MLYVDTSAVIKLYVVEDQSVEISAWLRANDETIPWTALHELEFNNAIQLKEFRGEIKASESRQIKTNFIRHEEQGVYFRPELNWADTFGLAIDLSIKHTIKTGSRSLDILHVATALQLKSDQFLTFDKRQSKLASLEDIRKVRTRSESK